MPPTTTTTPTKTTPAAPAAAAKATAPAPATDPKANAMSAVPATRPPDGGAPAVPAADGGDAMFDAIAGSGKYLPRLQMFGSKSKAVGAGKIAMAHYGLVTGKDNIQDLGPEVQVLAVSWRPKALDTSGDDVVNTHDHLSAEFRRIQAESEVKDSGCMFGPEFLVYIPAVKKWAGLFMSSATARREAPAIRERLDMPSMLGIEYIETKKYAWHGITCKPSSTPFDRPADEATAEQIQRFQNPPVDEAPEAAPEAPARAR